MSDIWLRRIAWLAVAAIIAWLLWMTLRPSREISVPGVRMGTPASEVNLRPFDHKVRAIKALLASDYPSARRSARTYLFVDVLGNIAVFVPLGAALAVATSPPGPKRRFGGRWWLRMIGVGLLLSLGIELFQLAIPSRATDVDDVILNTLGAMLGAIVAWGMLKLTSDE
jgi:glycopeptide antibiotics resistance protein